MADVQSSVEGRQRLTFFTEALGPIPTLGIQGAQVLTAMEAVDSVFPRGSVMDISDQTFVQIP